MSLLSAARCPIVWNFRPRPMTIFAKRMPWERLSSASAPAALFLRNRVYWTVVNARCISTTDIRWLICIPQLFLRLTGHMQMTAVS